MTVEEYPDSTLVSIIEQYPLPDANGLFPEEDGWTPRYDLNAAAADVWAEKAAGLAGQYDFSADGASFQRSQAYEQAMKQARYYRSRRALHTVKSQAYPKLKDISDDTQ
ncbi:MAG: hypothetical protein WHV44_00185 [Anaerolineales bacterium]